MTVLAMSLCGPLQSWGSHSRFTTRGTDAAPTKSGIIGLLAAARGLRRTDPLEELLTLRMAVRLDQPGEVIRDFQVARSLDGRQTMPLSYRYYRSDARYLVGVQGDEELLRGIQESLESPVFPLYLGRRACPPSEPLAPAVKPGELSTLLLEHRWIASDRWRHRHGTPGSLAFRIDDGCDLEGLRITQRETIRDIPVSFDPRHRQYSWRTVLTGWVSTPGADHPSDVTPPDHNPLAAVE